MSVIPILSHLFHHSPFTFHIYMCVCICIYFLFSACAGSSSLHGLSLVVVRRGSSVVGNARASPCSGFSWYTAQALGAQASVVATHKLSSCGPWAQLLWGMWNLPGPGIEPMYHALAGEFLSAVPPGKPYRYIFSVCFYAHLQFSTLCLSGVRYRVSSGSPGWERAVGIQRNHEHDAIFR